MPLQVKQLHPSVLAAARRLHFRQSFIKDYLSCPKMSLYRWILQLEEEQPFMAGFFGTAGHAVVYDMHEKKNFAMSQLEILEIFETTFYEEIDKATHLPSIAPSFGSIQDQFDEMSAGYVTLIQGYQTKKENTEFMSTIHEQLFVLEFPVEILDEYGNITNETFMFTGQIDQGGYYPDGVFALRDIKFRQDAFRPSRTEFDLDIQMTVYSAAMKWGVPSCEACRPTYDAEGERVYNGPCEACEAKIGTPQWPQKYPEISQLIWMRDYERRTKDRYAKMIKDPLKRKEFSSITGRKVIREVINPKWEDGYKKGDYKGPGLIKTVRSPSAIEIFMADVINICINIRNGVFYRNPGEKCNFWCRYREQCVRGVEADIDELTEEKAMVYGTLDPFDE